MVVAALLAGFLLAHGLIHIAFLSPAPRATAGGPSWPFSTERSWLIRGFDVPAEVARTLALVLAPLTVAGFALAAVVALGVIPGLWAPAIAIGSMASLALLIAFFHPWLVVGIGIDAVLLWVTFVVGWVPYPTGLL